MGSLQVLSYGTSGGRPATDKRPVYTGLFFISFWKNSNKKSGQPSLVKGLLIAPGFVPVPQSRGLPAKQKLPKNLIITTDDPKKQIFGSHL